MPSAMDGGLQTRADEHGRLERAWQDEGLWSRKDGSVGSVQRPLFLVNLQRAAERPGVARTTTICRGDRRHFSRVEGRCATSTVPMEKGAAATGALGSDPKRLWRRTWCDGSERHQHLTCGVP